MTKTKSKNRVYVNEDDVVELVVVGNQTVESINKMGEEAGRLGRQQWADGKPSLFLDNLFDVGKVGPSGMRTVIHLGKTLKYDKLAMVSNKRAIIATSNVVLRAIGKLGEVRFFDNREDAVKWLKQD